METIFYLIILFFTLIFFHELGHFLIAKHFGKFKRFVFIPWAIGFAVEVKTPICWREFILIGWGGFIFTLPFIILSPPGLLLIIIGLASFDFLTIAFVSWEAAKNPFLQITDKSGIRIKIDFGE